MFAYLMLAAALSPPPIVTTSVPPPPIIIPIAPPIVAAPLNRPVAIVSILVSSGQERLLNDRLRVGQHGATVNRTRREAVSGNCLSARGTLDESFYVQLSPDFISNPDRFRLEVRWGRPVQTGCDVGGRTVSLNQTFELKAGASVVFTGDAGLKVELRR